MAVAPARIAAVLIAAVLQFPQTTAPPNGLFGAHVLHVFGAMRPTRPGS
jgi:hypothetical protein